MSRVCNNQPYEDIENFVEQDLSIYGQHNSCPKSLTIVNGNLWRHYELGAILGFVIYNEFIKDPCDKEKPAKEYFRISTIEEDDENWRAPSLPMLVDAGWIKAIDVTWQRVVEWQKKHLIMGWDRGANITNPDEYRNEQKEPIVPEVIMWEDEEPDNAVLGTKYCFNDEEK